MKIALTLLSLTLVAGLHAKTFEGDLTIAVEADGESQEMSVTTKGDKMSIKLPELGGGFALMDWGSKIAKIVMPEQRMFLEAPAADLAPGVPEVGEGEVEVTNETKDILGFTTRKVIFTSGTDSATLWMTSDLGSFTMMGGLDSQQAPAEFRQAFPNGALALEMIYTDGEESATVRITAVNPRSVATTELEVPKGYSKMSLPDGMNFPGMP
ncbi:MAG: DUF4412 domain-containing protein [Verrucomicrobiota bacterium]